MGNADGRLAQDQFQVAALAFGTDLPDRAESQYVKGLAFIVEVVDYHARIELAEHQEILGSATA